MSYTKELYPKNYHASGIGLVNLAALGYYTNEKADDAKKAPPVGLYPALPYPTGQPSANLSYPQAPALPNTEGLSARSAAYATATSFASNAFAPSAPYAPSSPYAASAPYAPSAPFGAPYAPSTPTTPYPLTPMGMPQPGMPLYPTLPNESASSLPYPVSGYNMPMPQLAPLTEQRSSNIYPLMPPLPDHYIPTAFEDDKPAESNNPTQEEEPSVGVPEIPFSAVNVPENENMFWLGRKSNIARTQSEEAEFHVLHDSCLSNGTLFEDPNFPANDSSLLFSRRPDRYVQWLRPHEIVSDPQFFVEGYSRFDVQQGELGDCWLLAATANLTQEADIFFRVVPPDQSFDDNYAGIFRFNFWQYGKWVEVVIDDRLPTYNGELLYMHSTERNEFWSALLEKAYAKLHGSYEALKGGTTCEAMEDFTGGVTEWYDLKEAPPNLFSILMKAEERNSMMGCSLEPDPNVFEAETSLGLIRGHAYSITKICLLDIRTPNRTGKIPMIRMRNPWGNDAEWRGPWSDHSSEWRFIPEETKHEMGLRFDKDGEFWMSFQDFLNNFDRVEICNLSPDSLTEEQQGSHKRRWEMSMFEGEWVAGVTAGGCRNFLETFWHNPQYVITLEDPDEEDNDGKCTVIVALMQKNRRSKRNRGMECLTVGFAIYHLTERDMEQRPQGLHFFKYRASVARSPHFINTREICARFKLPPGNYLIVPSTFDPNEEGEFILRVFSETQNNMEENDDSVGYGEVDDRIAPEVPDKPEVTDPQRESLRRLFQNVAGTDNEVDWMELKRILDYSLRDVLQDESFSKDACRSMIALMDKDQTGMLAFDEFEDLLTNIAKWKAVFKLYDRTQSGSIDGFDLRNALKSAGYHLNCKILNALAHRYSAADGKITFDDFLMCAVKVKTYIDIFKARDTSRQDRATFSLDEWLDKTIYS